MAFEQRHSGCSNSLNPKCALREAVASVSPKVLHWLLSSVGELCTPRRNSCDRHLPGFSTTTHKTKCTFQSPALVSTSCRDSSLIVLCCFFSTRRETHTKKTEKPKSRISHRQLKHVRISIQRDGFVTQGHQLVLRNFPKSVCRRYGDTQGGRLIASVTDAKEAVAHERKRTHLS